jgi:hypothetical protein
MEYSITLFVIPAVVALLIKLVILALSNKSGSTSLVFVTMVLLFACHNIAEILGFIEFSNGEQATMMLRWYYVMSICVFAALLFYARDVSKMFAKNNRFATLLLPLVAVMCSLFMFTDLLVAGSSSISYVMTAVKGDFYWLYQAFSLGSLVLITWMLLEGYRHSGNHTTEIRCGYTMIALSPMVIGVFLVIALMALGFHINAGGIFPILTTLFLWITLKSESRHGITDIRRHVPFSLERKTSREIMNIFSSYAKDELNYRDSMAELEKLMVIHKHEKHDGNVSSTAVSMDIPRSSLYSIFRRLEIEHSEDK